MARASKPNNNLIFLASLALILVSTSALSINKLKEKPKTVEVVEKMQTSSLPIAPLPVLAAEDTNEEPIYTGTAIFAQDVDSGVTLYEKNADLQVYPASTTKIVTALVTLELYQLDDVVTISRVTAVGQKMGLVVGEQLTVEDLLKGMLIYSANDAAEALANHHPEGYYAFIDAMNAKAQKMSMTQTHFTNPHGLENWQHISTARDLAKAGRAAMNNPIFSEIVATRNASITSIDGVHSHKLTNINKLIGTVDGVLGVKTGYTEHAKENLVTYVSRNNKRVVIALLGSDDRFGETKSLIDWIYKEYDWEEVKLP